MALELDGNENYLACVAVLLALVFHPQECRQLTQKAGQTRSHVMRSR